MNLAAQWLSENKMKIGDIALELGYSNASKFAKAFQSVYGMLPKDYRKKINRKNGLFFLHHLKGMEQKKLEGVYNGLMQLVYANPSTFF